MVFGLVKRERESGRKERRLLGALEAHALQLSTTYWNLRFCGGSLKHMAVWVLLTFS
jgi:hypothetical protein